MDELTDNQNIQASGSNIVNMAEPIVTELRKLLTKQEIKGSLTLDEKKKYLHYINMLSEIYKERCRK